MVRIWAKREEQLKSVIDSSAGLYGDLQGIAGRALPEIESLGLLTIVDVPGHEQTVSFGHQQQPPALFGHTLIIAQAA
jgi:hypothetical protein